jgi:hypothetical protein
VVGVILTKTHIFKECLHGISCEEAIPSSPERFFDVSASFADRREIRDWIDNLNPPPTFSFLGKGGVAAAIVQVLWFAFEDPRRWAGSRIPSRTLAGYQDLGAAMQSPPIIL